MAYNPSPPRFVLSTSSRAEDLIKVFERIGKECRDQKATTALVVALGSLHVSRKDVGAAVSGLAEAGCASGFKLACVTGARDTFEEMVCAEGAGMRHGIAARIFFDEENALRWLAG
jgi:hypothetical protein